MDNDIKNSKRIKRSQSDGALCLEFGDNALLRSLFGPQNEHIALLEKQLDVTIADRGNLIQITGPDENIEMAETVISKLWAQIQKSPNLSAQDIYASIRFSQADLRADKETQTKQDKTSSVGKGSPMTDKKHETEKKHEIEKKYETEKKYIDPDHAHAAGEIPEKIVTHKKDAHARTPRQSQYIKQLRNKELVFGIGPAGTGKTYIAVGMAVEMYERKVVDRMVFCRPAVEAGENLGFLPGDLKEKIDPYIQPIYDALYDFIGLEKTEKLIERGDIEIAPLAFMRGRTLAHAFVLLDEAQNTSSAQMKMFLSRMGENSRMVVNGDPHQTDLPTGQISGLTEASMILEGIEGTGFTTFSNKDVVRHRMVRRVLDAYERNAR
tara:strand:+ start:492526 stop:493665 length:1140 start_codon:yes stop_codon:yes gene_type:complete